MKPITIPEKTRGRLLSIGAEINRLAGERDGLLTAILEANGIDNPEGWSVAPDYSQIVPPPDPQKTPEKKIPNAKKRGKGKAKSDKPKEEES